MIRKRQARRVSGSDVRADDLRDGLWGGGVFAVVFLRVAQSIAAGIIGTITRWWAG